MWALDTSPLVLPPKKDLLVRRSSTASVHAQPRYEVARPFTIFSSRGLLYRLSDA
jgi:hypothetical protein